MLPQHKTCDSSRFSATTRAFLAVVPECGRRARPLARRHPGQRITLLHRAGRQSSLYGAPSTVCPFTVPRLAGPENQKHTRQSFLNQRTGVRESFRTTEQVRNELRLSCLSPGMGAWMPGFHCVGGPEQQDNIISIFAWFFAPSWPHLNSHTPVMCDGYDGAQPKRQRGGERKEEIDVLVQRLPLVACVYVSKRISDPSPAQPARLRVWWIQPPRSGRLCTVRTPFTTHWLSQLSICAFSSRCKVAVNF